MAEKFNKEKERNKKLKGVKARLNFDGSFGTSRYSESRTISTRGHEKRHRSRHFRSPRPRPSVFLRIRREQSRSPKQKLREKEGGVFKRLGDKGKSVSARSNSYNHRSNSRYMKAFSESKGNGGGYWKLKSKKKKLSREKDDLSQPWVCEEIDPFTPRIHYFVFPKTRMHSHIKTYDENEDLEDQLKIFQATAKIERWAMPTWCHMFNSTLTGNAKVWFDDLSPESIGSYDDLKNYLQQKKYNKEPIELHNIKQRDGKSTKDFIRRYKLESRDVKGVPEQKKRGQATDKNQAIQEEVEKRVEAGIMKEVHYLDWLSNLVMVKKHDGSWKMVEEGTFLGYKVNTKGLKLIAELPMLTAPMEKEELIVYLAAAKETVSAVLMMEREVKLMPIYFVSRALRGPEVNYTSMEKLILALVHTNGSSCTDDSEARLILTNPKEVEFTYALRFRFDATNNKAEYEALIVGLRIAKQIGTISQSGLKQNQSQPSLAIKSKNLCGTISSVGSDSPERLSRTMENSSGMIHSRIGIKSKVGCKKKELDRRAPSCSMGTHTMIKSSNGDTPFSLAYETEEVIPTEIGMPTLRTAEVDLVQNNEALEINLDLLEERREEAEIRETKSKAKMEKYYNSKV
nr:reverse transcriptase domain-containing protein [Tanacetum cinerariifolium]